MGNDLIYMKNICYMSGAVINAGDYLIEKRTIQLLKKFIPDANISILNRVNIDYSTKLDYLNSFDGIIFAGGPMYALNLNQTGIPFIQDFSKLSSPVFFIGGGCWSDIYKTNMSEKCKSFFLLGCKNDVPLGCRDWYTYRFLKHNGFSNIIMTGCPAWYDLDYINKTEIKEIKKIRKIFVSEPAHNSNIEILNKLLYFLRAKYKDASITVVIHREDKKHIKKLEQHWKEKLNVTTTHISGSAEGFNIYNDADLHIGFRVHAHIYNLSRRNFSILFNEDIRGMGVNHALGLESINIHEQPIILRKKKIIRNYYCCQLQESSNYYLEQLDDIIDFSFKNDFNNYKYAFKTMNLYFESMKNHIQMINSHL